MGLDTGLSLKTCRRVGGGYGRRAINTMNGLSGAAGGQLFFQEGCLDECLTLLPHQQADARLSTEAGGLGLP